MFWYISFNQKTAMSDDSASDRSLQASPSHKGKHHPSESQEEEKPRQATRDHGNSKMQPAGQVKPVCIFHIVRTSLTASAWQETNWCNGLRQSYCLFHGVHYPHQLTVDTPVCIFSWSTDCPPKPSWWIFPAANTQQEFCSAGLVSWDSKLGTKCSHISPLETRFE